MRSPQHQRGTVTLMGSGEMMRSMAKVHRSIVSRIEGPVRAVFLDTPAGFELNADDISRKACEYVEHYVGVPCSIASFKTSTGATARQTDNVLRRLRRANYIFAGPGSPTYAARNWGSTPVFGQVAKRLAEGAHLVLASAAAIAVGRYALPVYEVYKAGEEPHWVDGVDLLGPYGLALAILTHWNNAEGGTFDTRYCFMGEPRLKVLEKLLPASTAVLGIDEHTACILDLDRNVGSVMGVGQVTVRRRGREATYEAGTSFDLDRLRSWPNASRERTQQPADGDSAEGARAPAGDALLQCVGEAEAALARSSDADSDLADVAGPVYDLAQALDEARDVGAGEELLSQGRAGLGRLVSTWGSLVDPSSGEKEGRTGPLVELLIDVRSRLRAAGQWRLADEIRDLLSSLGIILEDSTDKTTWRAR